MQKVNEKVVQRGLFTMSLLNSVESASPSLRASEPSEAAAQKLTRPDAIKRHWDIGVEVGELLSHDNI